MEIFINYKDESGSIERKELFEIMKRFRPEITEEEVSFIITQIDDDNSGKISYDGKISFNGLHNF